MTNRAEAFRHHFKKICIFIQIVTSLYLGKAAQKCPDLCGHGARGPLSLLTRLQCRLSLWL